MTLYTFASGSEGNCLLISHGDTHILVDAGISCRRIQAGLARLGLTASELSAILITHAHSDHICGLQTLLRRFPVPLYASAAAGRQLSYRIAGAEPLLRTADNGVFTIGELYITAFPTSHDAAGSIDYRIDDSDGSSIGILTDTGYVTREAAEALPGVGLLVLESNHDVDRLRSGPYPYPLKQRILGLQGHLSNDAAALFAAEMAAAGTGQIILAHLSRENNTPELALEAVCRAVSGYDVAVTVAPRSALSPPYTAYAAEVALCRR